MKTKESDAFALINDLLNKHFEETEKTIRKFKWLTNIPQHGKEYIENLNVWELQDKAIEELKQEKAFINNLMNKSYENINSK